MNKNQHFVGVGLRSNHYPDLENEIKTNVDWFEAISENYMNTEGRPLKMLLKVRETHPIALHGVGLSIGTHNGQSVAYLKKLKDLIKKVEPQIVTDHLCWSGIGGHFSHDLLPFPFTKEALSTIVRNVQSVQEFLGHSISLENISYYLKSTSDEMSESDFINEVCRQTGCGLLLDLNNIDVNAQNHKFNAFAFLKELNIQNIRQIHLAGPSQEDGFIFDTHSSPVPNSVWDLYKHFIELKSDVPVIVEWDENIPTFDILENETKKVRQIQKSFFEATLTKQRENQHG